MYFYTVMYFYTYVDKGKNLRVDIGKMIDLNARNGMQRSLSNVRFNSTLGSIVRNSPFKVCKQFRDCKCHCKQDNQYSPEMAH